MSVAAAIALFENAPVPDAARRAAVGWLVERRRRTLAAGPPPDEAGFAAAMAVYPVALHPQAANAQHYEVPAAFFDAVLGPHRKYSCGWYDTPATTLAEAEAAALERTCVNAALADGQRILELGCGWGSLSLWMAARFPASAIVAVSNAAGQRAHIEALAAARGLANLTVVTADMNDFDAPGRFDRIVSVEMFEHMANWRALLTRTRGWLAPDGRLFVHVFAHANAPYRFDAADPADWIAQHFFTGGVMPSHRLIRHFADLFVVEHEERWSGTHYARTARHWLANFDARRAVIDPVLAATYGPHAALWARRWRLFFLATEGLFGAANGVPWGVSHYRLRLA